MYTESIMKAVRQRFGYEEDDTSIDTEIMEMEPEDVLDEYLQWEGLLGWTRTLIDTFEDVYNVDFEERVFYGDRQGS